MNDVNLKIALLFCVSAKFGYSLNTLLTKTITNLQTWNTPSTETSTNSFQSSYCLTKRGIGIVRVVRDAPRSRKGIHEIEYR